MFNMSMLNIWIKLNVALLNYLLLIYWAYKFKNHGLKEILIEKSYEERSTDMRFWIRKEF